MFYEKKGAYVDQGQDGQWVVFRPSDSGTHCTIDSCYAPGRDGLSIAIARAMFIADGPSKGQARAALETADTLLASAKNHAAKMRAALNFAV